MKLVNVFSGSAFRLSLRLLAVFVVMLILAGTLLVNVVSSVLEAEIKAQLEEETLLLQNIYRASGSQGLIDSVIDLSKHSVTTGREAGLFDSDKGHLAGRISLAPDFIGWKKVTLTLVSHTVNKNTLSTRAVEGDGTETERYHVNALKLGKMTLVVGRSTRTVQRVQRQLVIWLLITGCCLAIGSLLLGYLASVRSFNKLNRMQLALQEVANGSLQTRLPVKHGNFDQIDHISGQMNHHLDHLERLINGIQATATAIAHDLKTPLSHAQIALYQAGDTLELGGDPREKIDEALDKLNQLNQTFDTVLRISKIQAHSDRSQFREVQLADLIYNMVDLLEPMAQQQQMRLETDIAVDTVPLLCDVGMIQQLLVNLINNAVTHCPEQSCILIKVRQQPQGIELLVEDNGSGITAADREVVLQPFSRLDSARNTPGNGLGLALVKAIVEQHQGQLLLQDAEPGLRVVIRFYLSD